MNSERINLLLAAHQGYVRAAMAAAHFTEGLLEMAQSTMRTYQREIDGGSVLIGPDDYESVVFDKLLDATEYHREAHDARRRADDLVPFDFIAEGKPDHAA